LNTSGSEPVALTPNLRAINTGTFKVRACGLDP
jgi:hypothetical protein